MTTFSPIRPDSPASTSIGSHASSDYSFASSASSSSATEPTKVFFVKETKTETSFFGLVKKQITRLHLSKLGKNGQTVRLDKVGIKTSRGFFETLFGTNKARITLNLSSKTVKPVTRKGQASTKIMMDTLSETVNAVSLASFFNRCDPKRTVLAKELSTKREIDLGAEVQQVALTYLQSHLTQQGNNLLTSQKKAREDYRERLLTRVLQAEDEVFNARAALLKAQKQNASRAKLGELTEKVNHAEEQYNQFQDHLENLQTGFGRIYSTQLNDINKELSQTYKVVRYDSDEESNAKIEKAASRAARTIQWIRAPEVQ